MLKRQLFICSAIETCRETANCCPHKAPHIKDERCIPRECRYARGLENIDCVPYEPEKPVTASVTTEEAKPELIEKLQEETFLKDMKEKEEHGEFVPLDQAAKELGIKDAVKKKASTKKPARNAVKKKEES